MSSGRNSGWLLPWLRGRWAFAGFIVLIGVLLLNHSPGPSNKLYGQLVQIAKDAKLPPAGAQDYWQSSDVTAQACPIASRNALVQMATEVGGGAVHPPGQGNPDETWTVLTGSDLLQACDHSTARTLQVRLSRSTGECHADASIAHVCDP